MGPVCGVCPRGQRNGSPAVSVDKRTACKVQGSYGGGSRPGADSERDVGSASSGGPDFQKVQIPAGEKRGARGAGKRGRRAWDQPGGAGGSDHSGPWL